ncbi:hypothetical protein, partial [Vandammella animalimorsus]|uniref:hypothetical protein n=1 Tax=Vandammella animalimorsus TaxID=2029117 RepID=UPI001EEE2F32
YTLRFCAVSAWHFCRTLLAQSFCDNSYFQTPTLIGCMFLMNLLCSSSDLDSHRFAISEALYYNTKFQAFKKFLNFLKSCLEDQFASSEALHYNTKKFQINKILKFFRLACIQAFEETSHCSRSFEPVN